MKKLNIEPLWNIPYHCEYNDAVEKFWSQLKQKYRRILLHKMLENPTPLATPLNDSLREAFNATPNDSIPKYIERGMRLLREKANEIRKVRKLPNKEEV